jgi:lipopolysaccharide biosynthesis protein
MTTSAISPSSSRTPNSHGSPLQGVIENWAFRPSPRSNWLARHRVKFFARHAERFPRFAVVKERLRSKERWIVYFCYCPTGQVDPSHRFTLGRLRSFDSHSLLVVAATPSVDVMDPQLSEYADVLVWKGLSGYDFSGYFVGLDYLVSKFGAVDACVFNDSVWGPFSDPTVVFSTVPGDFQGMIASMEVENHVNSFGFRFRQIDRTILSGLRSIWVPGIAYSDVEAVVLLQETRLARVASRHMAVGARWFAPDPEGNNLTLSAPFALIEQGFPFLKKALLTKHSVFCDREEVLEALDRLGHPVPPKGDRDGERRSGRGRE